MVTRAHLIFFACLSALALAGCSGKNASSLTPTLGLTQVYQTVEAMLTQAYTPPPATVTPTITPTTGRTPVPRTATPASAATSTPSGSPVPTLAPGMGACDQAAAGNPIDVTIPDDTEMQPGEIFTKIWKLENVGTCTWTVDYSASFFYGEQMGAPDDMPLSGEILPGQTVEISIEMIAPEKAGTYQGNWKLRNASGELFGIGPNGDAPFWVRIVVVVLATDTPAPTPTPTPTRTPTPLPTPTATQTPVAQAQGTFNLNPGDRLDLDTAEANPEAGADLNFQKIDFHWLTPWGGAQIGFYGSALPSLEVCQAATMSSAPVAVESLSTGTYLCYQTGEGAPGWMRLVEYNAETSMLRLEIFTWAIP